ncbi:hypothetical protein AOQ84DRAFT_186039 [Glonium stellatum]|uniref:BRCT domain-containing protein n=1 Tax=Glonium stellatum TaxID=574774 RepID=A0A8E2F6U7_9PEZI|nr:hypothetical protein AOQ84DRAFT_186039 [Glonium stellatum]
MPPHALAPAPPASSNRCSSASKPAPAAKPGSLIAAQPTRTFFDAWNSSSTGHQIADNRLAGSTAWRESRNLRLAAQFRAGRDGGERIADTVGAGSEDFGRDARSKANGACGRGLSEPRGQSGQRTLGEVLRARVTKASNVESMKKERRDKEESNGECKGQPEMGEGKSVNLQKQIFQGLCFYINGSTAPLISDHKLKQLLVERGAKISIALARRSVTHVILGTANERGGAGGGLAGGKIQKEITRVGGKGVKFVGIEWVVESIKAEKRLPEMRFAGLKLAPKGQASVLNMFKPVFKMEEQKALEFGNG